MHRICRRTSPSSFRNSPTVRCATWSSAGYAVGYHDRPRTTKDLDILLDSSAENIQRVSAAVTRFGAPTSVVSDVISASSDEIVWMGNPPLRVDFLKTAPAVDFAEAWSRRVMDDWSGTQVQVIGLDDLIEAKRAAGRPQDLVDLRNLERARFAR